MSYYKKYLKYKQKYLDFQITSHLVGGNNYIVTKECNKYNFIEFVKTKEKVNNYYFVISVSYTHLRAHET
jgi:hypothetical protein